MQEDDAIGFLYTGRHSTQVFPYLGRMSIQNPTSTGDPEAGERLEDVLGEADLMRQEGIAVDEGKVRTAEQK